MKKLTTLLIGLLAISFVFGLSNPVTFNGKQYYITTSTDPTEDTGGEVCAKAGMTCVGYTEPTSAVCKLFHPNAADSTSLSGDLSGVYCNGPPQNGVCPTLTDSCHTCPACTNTVDCNTAIGGLYREMYVECTSGPCKLSISVTSLADFINQIPGINAQLKACPQTIPKGTGLIFNNGNTIVNILTNAGTTQSVTAIITNGKVTGISNGAAATCSQRITVSENDISNILNSANPVQTVVFLIGQKKITFGGCTTISKIKFAFTGAIARFIAKRQAPTQPTPKPQPNCGQLGEQCNNRACWSGICAAPEENVNGQWRHVNYRCIDQGDFNTYCVGRGNTPAAWSCLTGPCR